MSLLGETRGCPGKSKEYKEYVQRPQAEESGTFEELRKIQRGEEKQDLDQVGPCRPY